MYADFGCRVQLSDNDIIHEENDKYHVNILLVYCEKAKHQLKHLEEEILELKRLLRKSEDTKLENENSTTDEMQFLPPKPLQFKDNQNETTDWDCEIRKLREQIDLHNDQSGYVKEEEMKKFRKEFEEEKVKLFTLKQSSMQTLEKIEEIKNVFAKRIFAIEDNLETNGIAVENLIGKVQTLEKINDTYREQKRFLAEPEAGPAPLNTVRVVNGRNLIKNCCGDDGLKFWIMNGGNWNIYEPSGYFSVESIKELNGIKNCFRIYDSHDHVKSQTIDLAEEGLSAAVVDEKQPDIYICDWYSLGNHPGTWYKLSVYLLDEKKKTVDFFTFEQALKKPWSKVEHTFKKYGCGVRYIQFMQNGSFHVFVTNSTVRILCPDN